MSQVRLPQASFAGFLLATLLGGCTSGREVAIDAALQRYRHLNPKLLSALPGEQPNCYGGCFTQICAVLEVDNERRLEFPYRDVIFVFVDGGDDEPLFVRGRFPTLKECMKNFNRG